MSVRLGYACISMVMRAQGVYCGRTLMLATLATKGVAEAINLARQNVEDLLTILKYNESVGIRFFRITSNLFPHLGNPKGIPYSQGVASVTLATVGEYARQHGHRLTFHPGQFAQLASIHERVVAQSMVDLDNHAETFIAMGMKPEHGSVMVIHGGGTNGDKVAAAERFVAGFQRLSPRTSQYIVLENDEFQWNVLDLLPICERLNIPLCIDFFHHVVSKDTYDIYDPALIQRVITTWTRRGIKPKFHWSNQKPGERRGTHGDCVEDIPERILTIAHEHHVDIMLETKTKDVCCLATYAKHFERIVSPAGRVEWCSRA